MDRLHHSLWLHLIATELSPDHNANYQTERGTITLSDRCSKLWSNDQSNRRSIS